MNAKETIAVSESTMKVYYIDYEYGSGSGVEGVFLYRRDALDYLNSMSDDERHGCYVADEELDNYDLGRNILSGSMYIDNMDRYHEMMDAIKDGETNYVRLLKRIKHQRY